MNPKKEYPMPESPIPVLSEKDSWANELTKAEVKTKIA